MLPNFFVVGAPKAGTTSLYNYLDQHPAVYLSPIKEPAFFAADLHQHQRRLGVAQTDAAALQAYLDGPMTTRGSGVVTDWQQYQKLFKNVALETAVGEVSGNYLGSSCAPRAIRDRMPGARIIMVLRDPVARLYSQHAQAASRGHARPEFLPWVEEQQALESRQEPRLGAVWNGFYARHLERYRACFAASQIKTVLYEQYTAQPQAVLRDLFHFLDVDPDFEVDFSRRHNETWQPRWGRLHATSAPLRAGLRRALPPGVVKGLRTLTHQRPRPITPAERAQALAIYADDIRALQQLLGLDLSAWLRG